MKTVREYRVHVGEGRFSVVQLEEDETFGETKWKAGYYGIEGVMKVTETCQSLEEAEAALEKKVIQAAFREIDKLSQRTSELAKTTIMLARSGLSAYSQ